MENWKVEIEYEKKKKIAQYSTGMNMKMTMIKLKRLWFKMIE